MAVTNYIWDELSDSVLMETDGSGATTVVYTQEPGPFGGLISERRGNQSRYYHYDGLGSTRQLTDATGQVTDTYLYDAFGTTIQSTGTSVVPYHFVGRLGYYFDQDLSEYYVRARHYDPSLARWLGKDPISYRGGINLYEYVGGSPLTRTDPDGTITRKQCFDAIKAGQDKMKVYIDAMNKMKPPCLHIGLCVDNKSDKTCASGVWGYHTEVQIAGKWLHKFILCYENIPSVTSGAEAAAHELAHVFDVCSGCKDKVAPGEVLDCFQVACTEIRAYSISGACLPGGTIMKACKAANPGCTYDLCVKGSAIASVESIPDCKGNARDYVLHMYPFCSVKEGTGTEKPIPWPIPVL